MKKVKIGIQGGKGSFSEEAAHVFSQNHGIDKPEIVYLISSKAVFSLSKSLTSPIRNLKRLSLNSDSIFTCLLSFRLRILTVSTFVANKRLANDCPKEPVHR